MTTQDKNDAKTCGSCGLAHPVEEDTTYCVKCLEHFDSGCMNEVNGSPVCFQCGEENDE